MLVGRWQCARTLKTSQFGTRRALYFFFPSTKSVLTIRMSSRTIARIAAVTSRNTSVLGRSSSTHSLAIRAQSLHCRPEPSVVPSSWMWRREFCQTEYSSSRVKISTGWATSTTSHSSTSDPAEAEAVQCLEQGTQKLEEGDVKTAQALYKRSVDIKRNASSLFNLGVTHYHLSESIH